MARPLTHLETFLTADLDEQFALLDDAHTREEVRLWLGPEAFSELESHRFDIRHLSAKPKNVIFLPGVMGSTLQSEGLGGVWWLDMVRARDKLNQLRLTDDGLHDIDSLADIQPGAVDLSYIPFRRALAESGHFGGSVQFPYDWRKPLRHSAERLKDTILQTYDDYQTKVHLVGHSMGGLMIRATLMLHGGELWPKVGRIVFLGTPHYGSPSISGYLKNHLWGFTKLAILGMFLSRETFRSLRGVLCLLPAPVGIYPGTRHGEPHPCANFDMYSASAWELGLDANATASFQISLDEVREFSETLFKWHQSLQQEYRDRMLMIAGVGQETLFRLEFDDAFWGLWEKTRKLTCRTDCDSNWDGDGRVPLASAQLENVSTRYVRGKHDALPNIPSVIEETLSWLVGRRLALSTTCEGALSAHLSADACLSDTPHLDGSEESSRYMELPVYERPSTRLKERIAADIDSGMAPGMSLVKIL